MTRADKTKGCGRGSREDRPPGCGCLGVPTCVSEPPWPKSGAGFIARLTGLLCGVVANQTMYAAPLQRSSPPRRAAHAGDTRRARS